MTLFICSTVALRGVISIFRGIILRNIQPVDISVDYFSPMSLFSLPPSTFNKPDVEINENPGSHFDEQQKYRALSVEITMQRPTRRWSRRAAFRRGFLAFKSLIGRDRAREARLSRRRDIVEIRLDRRCARQQAVSCDLITEWSIV